MRRIAGASLLFLLVGCVSTPEITVTESGHRDRILRTQRLLRDGALKIGNGRGGNGSGFAVDRRGDYTYILTCAHVVLNVSGPVVWRRDGGLMYEEIGVVFATDAEADLALVKVRLTHPLFRIATDDEYAELETGDLLLAAGYPDGVTPPALVTCGEVLDAEHDGGRWLSYSASGWYGFSGGPVADAYRGLIVGVTVRIWVDSLGALSDHMFAVPAPKINEFLNERLP